jgi:hypothetical protein
MVIEWDPETGLSLQKPDAWTRTAVKKFSDQYRATEVTEQFIEKYVAHGEADRRLQSELSALFRAAAKPAPPKEGKP